MSTSTHETCVLAAAAVIEGLALVGITAAQVLPFLVPVDRPELTGAAPFILLAPAGSETQPPGTNVEDDYGYPVFGAIVMPKNQAAILSADALLYNRQLIRNAFNYRKPALMTGPPAMPSSVYWCRFEPGPIIDLGLWKDANLGVSQFIIRCISRELRPTP